MSVVQDAVEDTKRGLEKAQGKCTGLEQQIDSKNIMIAVSRVCPIAVKPHAVTTSDIEIMDTFFTVPFSFLSISSVMDLVFCNSTTKFNPKCQNSFALI